MIPAIIGAILLLGGAGTTAVVADNAKPGDALYGVDRAVESMRLALAGEDSKNELKIRFAEERLEEVEELIDESSNDDAAENSDDNNATSSDDLSDDDSELDEQEVENVEVGLQLALDILTELSVDKENNPGLSTAIERLLNNLNTQIVSLPGDIDVRLDSSDLETDENGSVGRTEIKLEIGKNGKAEFESRIDGEKVHIKIEDDGSIEIETKEDRPDSDIRSESRFRSDRVEFELDSDERSSDDDDEDKEAEDILKDLEDAQKRLEKLQEREDKDSDEDDDNDDSRSDKNDDEDDDDSSGSRSDDDDNERNDSNNDSRSRSDDE